MLADEQVDRYERDGFLVLPGLVDDEWLARLRAVTAALVEESRASTARRLALRARSRPLGRRAPPAAAQQPDRRRTRPTGSSRRGR